MPAHVAFQGGVLSDTPPLPKECRDTSLSDEANARLQGKILGQSFMDPRDGIALVIRADEIPQGIGLNLTVQSGGNGWGWSLGLVRASPGVHQFLTRAPATTSRSGPAGPDGAGSRGRPC